MRVKNALLGTTLIGLIAVTYGTKASAQEYLASSPPRGERPHA